jgi:hypothetical protein
MRDAEERRISQNLVVAFGCGRLPNDDGTRGLYPCRCKHVGGRHVVLKSKRADWQAMTGSCNTVLNGDRDTMQRPKWTPLRHVVFRLFSFLPRFIEHGEAIQLRLEPFGTCNHGVYQCDRR